MARTRVYISSQYIVLPDSLLRDAIQDAARRGLDVRILTNSLESAQDLGFSGGYFLTLNYLDEILKAGAKVYTVKGSRGDLPSAYLHSKDFIIDGEWAAIGSFNLSIRSAYIESENLVTIMEPAIVGELEALFLDLVRTRATEITASDLKEQKEAHLPRISMARRLELFC
jgi:cardiolipin synthase A/B